MSEVARVAVVVPYFQHEAGVLRRTIESVFDQTAADRAVVIVVDDGSPVPASGEIAHLDAATRQRLIVIRQDNGGAGAARNRALDEVPADVEYVAFLDSDDAWDPGHLENALHALERGYDFYFSDYLACDIRDQSNFTRIGTLRPAEHELLDPGRGLYAFKCSAIDHIVRQGNVIGTSNVVYRYRRFPALRFREEFFNGQDFFFWMDLGELGARIVFSTRVECDCGRGINIYSGSGWGTEPFLRRVRNELKVWVSAERIYRLEPDQVAANRHKIDRLQAMFVRGILHRLARRQGVPWAIVASAVRLGPGLLLKVPLETARVVMEKART